MIKRQRIIIIGRVQGVGFRPAVYRLARELSLKGFVLNDTKGVTVELQGDEGKISEFLVRLKGKDKPPAAVIAKAQTEDIATVENEGDFIIRKSDYEGTATSQVCADMAVCGDCLREMRDENDFRYGYPFINCTNCGPRYSIVKTIPYDRPNTTMSVFKMCEKCGGEYKDVTDRRFHAQPVACGKCGPKVWLCDSSGKTICNETQESIARTAALLKEGKIAAIKGVGGFHLAVDALNNEAVLRLRGRKHREYKPFAIMTDSIEKIKKYAIVSSEAEDVLKSIISPIVLLPKKEPNVIAKAVAEGVSTFGFMLCYAPLHYLLFAQGLDVLVMTSGNISDEPLICKNETALEKLGSIADVFLMHDREIFQQIDDSIVHFIDSKVVPLRRARGYVPTPVLIKEDCPQNLLATGSDLKNTFCVVKQNQLICSEHIGDLEDALVYHHYVDSIKHLCELFEVEPEVIVCDLHPAYFSTMYAKSHKNVRIIEVQHHWAHIASVLSEHNIDGPVIGLACDGTGYGTDGKVWGCECMKADLDGFERLGYLDYFLLAGADKASKEAIRPLIGLLKKAYGEDFKLEEFNWLLGRIEPEVSKQQIVFEQLEKKINVIESSSLGRIFDAAAAMIGIGSYNRFDGQLPIAMEAIAKKNVQESYDFEITGKADDRFRVNPDKMIREMVSDIKKGVDCAVLAAKFHNTIAEMLSATAEHARKITGLNTVALSGGVFCNRYLTEKLLALLKKQKFIVLWNQEYPSNDAGLCLGQAAIGARAIQKGD